MEYALNLGLLTLYTNYPDIYDDLVSNIANTPNQCYDMLEFADDNPAINPIFDSVFDSRFNDFNSFSNWQSYVDAKYVYDTTYRPFARFINYGTVDLSQPSFVAMPFEVDEEKFTQFDDNLPMWIKSPQGIKFTTINEPQIFELSNPIVLISNGFLGDATRVFTKVTFNFNDTPVYSPLSCMVLSHFHENINVNNVKVNHRYERTGKTDFVFFSVSSVGYDPATFDWIENYGEKIQAWGRAFSSSEMGVYIPINKTIFSKERYPDGTSSLPPLCFDIEATNSVVDYTFMVAAYEKDDYGSFKYLGSYVNVHGDTIKMAGRRKFQNEWYYFEPNSNTSYPMKGRHPSRHTTWVSFEKGEIELHRWD